MMKIEQRTEHTTTITGTRIALIKWFKTYIVVYFMIDEITRIALIKWFKT